MKVENAHNPATSPKQGENRKLNSPMQWRERLQGYRMILVSLEKTRNATGYDTVTAIVPKDTLQSERVTLPEQVDGFSAITDLSVEQIRFIDDNGTERFVINPASKRLPHGHAWEIIGEEDSFHIALKPPLFWQDAPITPSIIIIQD